MPEGPEIWILTNALNKLFTSSPYSCKGKHLRNHETNEDWSFGLSGKVFVNDSKTPLQKLSSGYVTGGIASIEETESKLGLDWLTASLAELQNEIASWSKSKKKLGTILLDQSKICGIGVAWGSEILKLANLQPQLPANQQNLVSLAGVMIHVRDNIQNTYMETLKKEINLIQFVNSWFENLYEIRNMQIYKKGKKVEVSGRNWWV